MGRYATLLMVFVYALAITLGAGVALMITWHVLELEDVTLGFGAMAMTFSLFSLHGLYCKGFLRAVANRLHADERSVYYFLSVLTVAVYAGLSFFTR